MVILNLLKNRNLSFGEYGNTMTTMLKFTLKNCIMDLILLFRILILYKKRGLQYNFLDLFLIT